MSLQDEINKWAKSAAGRKKIDAVRNGALKPPNYYAQRLTEILDSEINKAGFSFGDYLYWFDEGYSESEKKYELHVKFKPEEISRPSLAPEKYRDGAYDIVSLMNKGYHASGAVHGEWHGNDTWSLRTREGAFFIQKAVEEFNKQYGNVARAEYSD